MNSDRDICLICLSESDDINAMCNSNHLYCIDCLNQLYESMIAQGSNINNKCSVCFTSFHQNKLEALLNDDIKLALTKIDVLQRFSFPSNFKIMACPTCEAKNNEGMFLIDENDYNQYYFCDTCNQLVCLYCYKACLDKSMHSLCLSYNKIAIDLEKLIERAFQVKCSECIKQKNSGYEPPNLKMNDCTHIKCNKCNMHTCYICSGHETKVNKSDKTASPIYRHNDDWKSNSSRCPMYVRHFSEIYSDWPKDEYKASAKLYEYKIKLYVKKIYKKHGKDKVKLVYNHLKDRRLVLISDTAFRDGFENFTHYPNIDEKILNYFKI